MTTRGRATRKKSGRDQHVPEAHLYPQKPRGGHLQQEDPPEAYRPFLDALAELLAAEAIRRSRGDLGTQDKRTPTRIQEQEEVSDEGAVLRIDARLPNRRVACRQ